MVKETVFSMNNESIINKFIEKCGPLDPLPDKHFIQNTANGGRFGLTTELTKVIDQWRNKSLKDYGKLPTLKVSPGKDILPSVHVEANGFSFDWDESDLMKAMRILQNHPFSKVSCFHSPEPMPIAFKRNDSDIAILLAPLVLPIKKHDDLKPFPSLNRYRGNPFINPDRDKWVLVSNLPNCTFQLWNFDCVKYGYSQNTVLATTHGYPIAELIKCSNCGLEIGKEVWINRLVNQNHPECSCSCETWGDECGCRRMRERVERDRAYRAERKKIHFMKRSWVN